jgi:c-di-GMP-binding flagellar brake protein YcgR
MSERRKYLRLGSALNAKYSVLSKEEESRKTEAVTKDISAGGIRIFLKEAFKPGTKLHLEISLPDESAPVNFIAEVVWQQEVKDGNKSEMDTGLKYIEVSTIDRQKLTKHILDCLKSKLSEANEKLSETQSKKTTLSDILHREIRLPGDNSRIVAAPDFLIHEVNLPGDKIRYCRIKDNIKINCKFVNGEEEKFESMGQYLSGAGMWLLLDKEVAVDTILELNIELPGLTAPIAAVGKIIKAQSQLMCDDQEAKVYYETLVRFESISSDDRRKIIRYVYTCRRNYIMLGKNLSPDWI